MTQVVSRLIAPQLVEIQTTAPSEKSLNKLGMQMPVSVEDYYNVAVAMSQRDPDGNGWLFQEVTTRLPGRIDSATTTLASANDLARALKVKPASVTGMIQKLASEKPALVAYQKHQGVTLTAAGKKAAPRRDLDWSRGRFHAG